MRKLSSIAQIAGCELDFEQFQQHAEKFLYIQIV